MSPELEFLKKLTGGTTSDVETHEVFTNLVNDAQDLNESEFGPAARELIARIAARGVRELFSFCLAGFEFEDEQARMTIRRFFAVAWLLHSEMLLSPDKKPDGRHIPMTLDKLGKLPQLDCTRCNLSILAHKFGKQFGFRARVQKRAYSKANYARSAKAGWDKRRLRAKRLASSPAPEASTG